MNLESELVMELTVECSECLEVGKTNEGFLRVIPIIGGTVSGPNIKGTVIPGGADWNVAVDEKLSHVFAKYCFKTDDGVVISIENEGYIENSPPENTIIKTVPKFGVDKDSKYEWLRNGVFVGSLGSSKFVENGVDIKIYKLK